MACCGRPYESRKAEIRETATLRRRRIAGACLTRDYTLELTGRGEAIDGECSCPAYEDSGSCKPLAATALALRGVYAGRVSQLAEAGNNHAYEEAARLVAPVQKHDPGSGYGANAVPGL